MNLHFHRSAAQLAGISCAGRVERWRGGLGAAYLCPALSSAGASLAAPCSVSTLPLIEPCVRISRTRLSDWLLPPAHDVSFHFSRDSENFTSSLASKVLSVTA